ncbi:MAG: hypothetical protein COV74_08380 [Candidatus Omnitrophica bacterium CG11_big_fil_rev_8_21_14_0_20_45_26]|uniref:NADH-quinone oxidoreductase subunit J n=1 Tax=Candidatus Abzuiibacterium crystallinum TaxID=1974748 RepID=A0A2H0LM72_9BACT|nr:MAG: hypothetical protein COV74_08380 [Candidatus Omnitrophica bacterium CG11_big_fil_rev_8_21_14_0_20_45_26]PIW63677.1 MAG: hypothetical protein COW12_09265 [Candidatus Omnitrophica bacterium CG12_big_fil_rev_8_21_14_0_65_45_16]
MEVLTAISKVGIYVIFGVTLLGAMMAVTLRNIFHAALSLALTLIGVAAVFFVLRAEFLGAVQILLYVGGIMILVIFTVMLTTRIGDRTIPTSNHQQWPVLIGALLLLLYFVRMIGKTPWSIKSELAVVSAVQIGKSLVSTFIFPFELTAVILVAILIGTVILAKSDEGEEKS